MAKYTIEDIEILRQKSGISYEEAVNLLEYHNGSLARALVDLEKNGRIKTKRQEEESHKGFKGALNFLYRLRLLVTKGNTVIVNLSVLFLAVALLMCPYLCIIGLALSLILGYHITFKRNSREFAGDSFENMVSNAKENVHQSVRSFAQQFTAERTADAPKPGKDAHSEAAPSSTRPVNVQFPQEGSVGVHDDGDGYHEADIR